MKKTAIALGLTLVLGLTANHLNATIRRVGFTASSSPVFGIDFYDLQSAHDNAKAGDTIQVYPSPLLPGYSATFNKKLVVLGAGYLYNSYTKQTSELANAGLQNLVGGNGSVSVTIGVGSSGSIFSGLNGLNIATSNVPDSLNNISILRSSSVGVTWDNSGVCNNWLISQCNGVSVSQTGYGASFTGNRTIANFRIENCLGGAGYGGISVGLSGSPVGISSGNILNCTCMGGYSFALVLNNQSVVVQNCISDGWRGNPYYYPPSGIANTIFINNISNAAAYNNPMFTNPGSTGNIFGVTFDNNAFFLGYPTNTSGSTVLNSPDTKYQLSSTSPAKNAGLIPGTNTPTDCGAYGGTNPYKPSGIPAIPAFYRLNSASSSAGAGNYTLTFSVRSNN